MSTRRRMMMAASVRKNIVNLPLGAKIKLSSGKKFIVQAKNVAGHEANSVTLVGEFVTENYRWNINTERYQHSYIHKTIMPRYYNELTLIEKNSIIKRAFKFAHEEEGHTTPGTYYYDVNSYFWIPSGKELNLPKGIGTNLGFTDNASRKKTFEGGASSGYYTTTSHCDADWNMVLNVYSVYVVNSNGAQERKVIIDGEDYGPNYTNFTTGILPCCDTKGSTKCKKGADGYWRIVEK